jgi:prefoldin subunit 5
MTKQLRPGQNEITTEDSQAAFPDLSARQAKLKQKTQGIGQTLEMLSQLFPGMDTEIINDLKAAAGSMGSATGRLKGRDAPGAIPPEQEAIQHLSRSQQAMQQMAQQMAQRMRASRWASPWGYDPRASWYHGPWAPMPTLPQPAVNRPLERGYTGLDHEEFDTPAKDAYKAPRMLREKVMEALKGDIPAQYRREVERYFRELTQ